MSELKHGQALSLNVLRSLFPGKLVNLDMQFAARRALVLVNACTLDNILEWDVLRQIGGMVVSEDIPYEFHPRGLKFVVHQAMKDGVKIAMAEVREDALLYPHVSRATPLEQQHFFTPQRGAVEEVLAKHKYNWCDVLFPVKWREIAEPKEEDQVYLAFRVERDENGVEKSYVPGEVQRCALADAVVSDVFKRCDGSLSQVYEAALAKIREIPDVVERAVYFHQWMVHRRPFVHGNGRVARLVMQRMLQLSGLSPLLFLMDSDYRFMIKQDFVRFKTWVLFESCYAWMLVHGEASAREKYAAYLPQISREVWRHMLVVDSVKEWEEGAPKPPGHAVIEMSGQPSAPGSLKLVNLAKIANALTLYVEERGRVLFYDVLRILYLINFPVHGKEKLSVEGKDGTQQWVWNDMSSDFVSLMQLVLTRAKLAPASRAEFEICACVPAATEDAPSSSWLPSSLVMA